jgi:urease accessory protein
VLAHAYAEPPLRVGQTLEAAGAAYVILACSGPGLFGGDRHHHVISIGRGARVLLVSQSSLQVHPAPHAEPSNGEGLRGLDADVEARDRCAAHHEYTVEDDAELHCVWDPVIPFAGARIAQRFIVDAAVGSRVYWSDALMSGRTRRGESWRFDEVSHEFRLAVGGSLKYLERYVVRPGGQDVARLFVTGGADYVGTSLVYHDRADEAVAGALQRSLDGVGSVSTGVDLVEERLLVSRMLSSDGAAFARARALFRRDVLDAVFRSPGLVARR